MKNKILLFVLPFFIFLLGFNNVKAETINYDMSKWIDVSEFTLPNGINPDDYNIIIVVRGNGSYRLIADKKINNRYCEIYDTSKSKIFPYYSDIWCSRQTTSWFNVEYYDAPSNSFIFSNSKQTGSNFSGIQYIVYTNFNLYNYYEDLGKYNTEPLFDIENAFTPTINITKFSDTSVDDVFGNTSITSISYNVNFSSFNTNKYKYLYSLDLENWIEINENDYKLLIKKNGTFYVQVNDLDDNYITSATYTVTGIGGVPPTIIKDVNYEYIDEKGNKITYSNLIKIPIEYLYNNNSNKWNNYKFIFLSKNKEDITSDILVMLDKKEGSDSNIPLPLKVNIAENLKDISDIEEDEFNGTVFNKQPCDKTALPFVKTIYNDNSNYYNVLELSISNCSSISNYTPSGFNTEYIYIYFNARVYKDVESAVEDYNNNPDNFENSNDIISYFEKAFSFFMTPIKNIFRIISIFYNRLPYQLRYMFIAMFALVIATVMFKLLF